ncbi:MAG: N-acetylmuramoyl-L-alanine amidase [Candidatus Kerfeldbacteria bacterium]|nr:N-acetylmuramoyl-L-alanine amidase [Candidatus Kerfeldbacteria bacterium]
MRYLLFALFAWLTSCAGDNGGMGTKPWPPDTNPNDTAAETDTDVDSDTDADSDSDSDTDTDSGTDECVDAAELCGMNLDSQIELRGIGWGVGITTQYEGYVDWTDAEQVAAGIAAGYYPPVPSFPDVSSYPTAYNDATWYLNNWYGWNWCCSALDWPAEYHNPEYITIHHTAGRFDDVLDYTEFVYNYHTFGPDHGWGDIGYQRLVGRDADDGEIHHIEGRYSGDDSPSRDPWGSLWVIGAHVGDHNTNNAGISVIGTYTDAPPDVETLVAIKAHAARTAYEIGLTDTSNILGHRDWASTECPGEELYALLPEIRDHVDWCQNTCGLTPPSQFASSVLEPTIISSREQFGD